MPDRAGIGADTYRIPVQQPYNAAMSGGGAANKPYDDGLEFEKSLQEAEGQTQAYYEKVAALKSFMLDMHKNRGIDVRVPDLAHPDSIALNQIYQRGLADIMHQANKLKMNQKEREYRINRGDIMTEAGRANERAGQPLQQGYDYYGNQPTAGVSATNAETAQPAYTQGSFAEQQKRAATERAVYEKMKKDNPKMAEYADAQLQAINTPTQDVFAPKSPWAPFGYAKEAQTVEAAGGFLKKVANVQAGLTGFVPTREYTGKMANKDYTGWAYGDANQKIKAIVKDPNVPRGQYGYMVIHFQDGTVQDISDEDSMTIAQKLADVNPSKLGGLNSQHLYAYIQQNSRQSESGEVITPSFLPDEKKQKSILDRQKAEHEKEYADAAPIYAALKEGFDKLKHVSLWNPSTWSNAGHGSIKIPLPDGKKIEVIRDGEDSYSLSDDSLLMFRPKDPKKQDAFLQFVNGMKGVSRSELERKVAELWFSGDISKGKAALGVTNDSTLPVAPKMETPRERINRLKAEAKKK